MSSVDIGLYVLLLILLIGYEFARSKRGRFDLLSLINLFFLLGYILGPLWMLYEPSSIPVELTYSRLPLTPVYVTTAYLSLLIGWIGIGRLYFSGQTLADRRSDVPKHFVLGFSTKSGVRL